MNQYPWWVSSTGQEKEKKLWRFFDARTYRSGPLDRDYLIGLMEQLL